MVLLSALAKQTFGEGLCIGGGYRSYAEQARLHAMKPGLAVRAGTSNHGFGTAVDFCAAAASEGSRVHQWLHRVGPRYGWIHPSWARPGGSRPEAWHFEYVRALDTTLAR
jgi:LAS superfamily LD-carboxypeptidase LdcB